LSRRLYGRLSRSLLFDNRSRLNWCRLSGGKKIILVVISKQSP
jgi:hypothetical protein